MTPRLISGGEAFEILNRARHDPEVNDYFSVEHLDAELPTFARQLGGSTLLLARTERGNAGTFKGRGALIGAIGLGASSIVCPSAGNHARGSIIAAKYLETEAHIVVPTTAPPAKKEGLRELWADPRLHIHVEGETFDESLRWALENPELGELLHPFDDPNVITGQGTIVDDLLETIKKNKKAGIKDATIRHIITPVGGGGLVAGILQRTSELEEAADITIHAVEATGSNSLSESLRAEVPVEMPSPNTRYGGSAVRKIGDRALEICLDHQKRLNTLTVTDHEVDRIIDSYDQDRYDNLRLDTPPYEPTSIVALAGIGRVMRMYPGETVVVIGTGRNAPLYPDIPPVRGRRGNPLSNFRNQ